MKKLYVLIRSDLSRSQQAVQGGHAVAAFAKANPDWDHHTLVYLRVRGLDELLDWHSRFNAAVPFYEPDIGGEMTAFAHLTNQDEFESLRLL